jgi:voltage-gated potassium channel
MATLLPRSNYSRLRSEGDTAMLRKLKSTARYITDDSVSHTGRFFNLLMLFLIVVSISIWLIESDKSVTAEWRTALGRIESICMHFFMAEYVLRAFAWQGKAWRYFVQPMALIDLLAIAPFFLAGSSDTAVLRLVRLFRIFRIFKLARYSESLNRLVQVFRLNAGVLGVFLFLVFVILMISATLMHTIEPQRFTQLTDALWWSIVTLTTVGYGDIVPESLTGKAIAAVLMVFGIGIIALPTGVLGASLTKLMLDDKKKGSRVCPRCGEQEHFAHARYCHKCGERLSE